MLTDDGQRGAEQGLKDDQTTGRFLKHGYALEEIVVPADGDLVAAFRAGLAKGTRLFVADLREPDLLAVAPVADAAGAILFSVRASDDELRTDRCFRSVFHIALSRSMKADALAQYLVWKRWQRWFLIQGSHPEDELLAEAYRRAATKFGAKIVAEKVYQDTGGARRTDTGHVQIQSQMPVFTQDAGDYDVDRGRRRGRRVRRVPALSHLGSTAGDRHGRPDAGQLEPGARAVGRHAAAAALREAGGPADDGARLQRLGGDARDRRGGDTGPDRRPEALHDYLLTDGFEVGAFKGQGLTFRRWDQQMRQPVLLVTPRMLVSVSPQDQFLHQRTPLDTLGFDEPESRCRLN